MLGWALTFAVLSLICAAIGFGGLIGLPAAVAQVLCPVFALLFAATVLHRRKHGKPSV